VPRQEYSRELKVAAMREIDSGKGMAEVARMYQLSPKRLESGEASGARKAIWPFLARVRSHKANSMPIGSLSWNVRSASRPWRSTF
jgi:hypothetical protein